jgi:hypothetical protein
MRSILPSGWNLAGDGAWDGGRRAWVQPVVDGADVAWELRVAADDVGRLGRIEALRRAVDRLYREALG